MKVNKPTIAQFDQHCQVEGKDKLCSWEKGSGGMEAKKLIQLILQRNNAGVNMKAWTNATRQKMAKWLKRERGVTLYLQRKRPSGSTTKARSKGFIPYYIDPDHAIDLGLKATPDDATLYTHSARAGQTASMATVTNEPIVDVPENQYYEAWSIPESGQLPVPPLPEPLSYSDFSSYSYYQPQQMDAFYLAMPPLEHTNQAFNVVS